MEFGMVFSIYLIRCFGVNLAKFIFSFKASCPFLLPGSPTSCPLGKKWATPLCQRTVILVWDPLAEWLQPWRVVWLLSCKRSSKTSLPKLPQFPISSSLLGRRLSRPFLCWRKRGNLITRGKNLPPGRIVVKGVYLDLFRVAYSASSWMSVTRLTSIWTRSNGQF